MSAPAQAAVRSPVLWPGMIFALIGLNVCIVGITVFAAAGDPSVATEPDYYAKAVNFNDMIRQRETNARLGWTAAPTIRPTPEGGAELVITVADGAGLPIDLADVTTTAFASSRSGSRQKLTLRAVAGTPGVYSAPIRIDRAGFWVLRMTVRGRGETFTRDSDVFLPLPGQ